MDRGIEDVLQECFRTERTDRLLKAIGYKPMGEFGIPGRRCFPKGGDNVSGLLCTSVVNLKEMKANISSREPRVANATQTHE